MVAEQFASSFCEEPNELNVRKRHFVELMSVVRLTVEVVGRGTRTDVG